MDTDDCHTFLGDFAAMAPRLYLLTRTRTDFDAVLLDLVAESEAYDQPICRTVDHDPVSYQLRVIGERPFAAAQQSLDDVHYEVLLRSRIATE